MKVRAKTVEETIVGAEKEMKFQIDTDSHIIFEILRDKMYSDKIGAVAREVASNSRDANREAGRADKPIVIEIVKPNKFASIGHQSIVFHDNGIGITPDRMADVFIKYASSTKRDSNKETGGFGLGAKTPFAYSDTFTVITTCDWAEPITEQQEFDEPIWNDDYTEVIGHKKAKQDVIVGHHPVKRIQYTYNAIIDESNKGKMILFDQEETTEPTGTKIVVPIKNDSDRNTFESRVMDSTEFWGDSVEYRGFNSKRDEINFVIEEDNFSIVKRQTSENYALLIDDIYYPLKDSNVGINDSGVGNNYTILLKFGTGELTISANREAVQYDDITVKLIKERLEHIKDRISTLANEYVETLPSYYEACKFAFYMMNAKERQREEIKDDYLRTIIEAFNSNSYYYHNETILSNDRDRFKTISFGGKQLKPFVKLKHHKICYVSEPRWGGDKTVYDDTVKVNITESLKKCPIYYGDARKDRRRNETIWENDKTFLLFLPTVGTDKEKTDEINNFMTEFDLDFSLYSDVEKAKTESSGARNYAPSDKTKVQVRYRNQWNDSSDSNIIFLDRKTKKFTDDNAQKEENFFVFVVESLGDFHYVPNDVSQKARVVAADTGKTMIIVNRPAYDNWISHTSIETLDKAFKKVERKYKKRWLVRSRREVIYSCFYDATGEDLEKFFKDLHDEIKPIMPKCVQEVMDFDMKKKDIPYIQQEVKFVKSGLKKKLKTIFDYQYPMLLPYICDQYKWHNRDKINKVMMKKVVESYIKNN